jgi:hypothetical protein
MVVPDTKGLDMGMLDGLLGQVGGNIDIANLASKIGLSEEQIQQGMAALGQAHHEPGDTIEAAAGATGLPTDKLQEIVGAIGGEGSLGRFADMLKGGGEGGMLGGLAGMASGLFGNKS